MRKHKYSEIEVRFLEIDKKKLMKTLILNGARDLGEVLLDEYIFYDNELTWSKKGKFLRLRKVGSKAYVTYKHHHTNQVITHKTTEIESEVGNSDAIIKIFQVIGLVLFRHQQKKRHSFILNSTHIDIDTWPEIPSYVEFEGKTVSELKKVVLICGLEWKHAVKDDAKIIIEDRYHIPVSTLKNFTFKKVG